MHKEFIAGLNDAIEQFTGRRCAIRRLVDAGGGSISRAFIANTDQGRWFVKQNRSERLDMFVAEADGLQALAGCRDLRVPRVIGSGAIGADAFIILEYVELHPLRSPNGATSGRALAALHRTNGAQYGWHRANHIGSTPQTNRTHAAWPEFFKNERLRPQLALAERHGYGRELIDNGIHLTEKLPALFSAYQPQASLLHGDLWSGNAACDSGGRLVVFDPAVYYGDREADLSMTELFGGFPASFYEAYRDAWPLADGYPQRRTLYNLYHVLNHLNLFGGGYLRQAQHMIGSLLAELG